MRTDRVHPLMQTERKEGRKEGRNEGTKEGRKEGRKEGIIKEN